MRRAVLVTRPEPGAGETMEWVASLGWTAIACPMLDILRYPVLDRLDAEAIAITSANALPALAQQPRDRLLLAVGQKTAERARQAGFVNVIAASGDAASLAELCCERHLRGARLVLACGAGYGVEWARDLGATRYETYRVAPVRQLSPEALQALNEGRVDAVLFYSGETASAFLSAYHGEREGVRALCLSDAIRTRVHEAGWALTGRLEDLGCRGGMPLR